jgi:hypothetical protein
MLRAAWAFSVMLLSGCFVVLDHELPVDNTEFVASRDDFADFQSWPSVVVGTQPGLAPHEVSERRVYLNFAPPDDATAFPPGTIIVKTGSGEEATGGVGDEIHAMVKRGAGFNADGALGWEWFEIALDNNGEPLLVWRGAEPPAGENYGCPVGQVCETAASCNSCHADAGGANDSVNSPALQLGNIDASLLGGSP